MLRSIGAKYDSHQVDWIPGRMDAQEVSRSEKSYIYRFPLRSSFWQRCTGNVPSIEVSITLVSPVSHWTMTDVRVIIRPLHCQKAQAEQALNELGPELLESLRNHLQAGLSADGISDSVQRSDPLSGCQRRWQTRRANCCPGQGHLETRYGSVFADEATTGVSRSSITGID